MEVPSPFEVEFEPQLKPPLASAALMELVLPGVVIAVLGDRLADSLLPATGIAGRALFIVVPIFLIWRHFRSTIYRLVLSDTALECTCVTDDVRYARGDIDSVTLWLAPSNGAITIGVRTRGGRWRRRFRGRPRGNPPMPQLGGQAVLQVERDLLEACRARGIEARTATIFVWR